MLWVSTRRAISLFCDQNVRARSDESIVRLILLFTVSACQRWPYFSLFNRVFS